MMRVLLASRGTCSIQSSRLSPFCFLFLIGIDFCLFDRHGNDMSIWLWTSCRSFFHWERQCLFLPLPLGGYGSRGEGFRCKTIVIKVKRHKWHGRGIRRLHGLTIGVICGLMKFTNITCFWEFRVRHPRFHLFFGLLEYVLSVFSFKFSFINLWHHASFSWCSVLWMFPLTRFCN